MHINSPNDGSLKSIVVSELHALNNHGRPDRSFQCLSRQLALRDAPKPNELDLRAMLVGTHHGFLPEERASEAPHVRQHRWKRHHTLGKQHRRCRAVPVGPCAPASTRSP